VKIALFCHSLLSDWNHGNAHFLRGIVAELRARGHEVESWEPANGWSRANLLADAGPAALGEVRLAFPWLGEVVREYGPEGPPLEQALEGTQLVIVHEWNDPALVAAIGRRRERDGGFALLFHDTHHRAASAPREMERFDLDAFDGVLAFGEVIRRIYLDRGWARRAWTWHEAADERVFSPRPAPGQQDQLAWVGNWGDGERSEELRRFLLRPARRLRAGGTIHGVRYPLRARLATRFSGLRYRGWLPNHRVPELFAGHRVTVHVPRRPYARALPGIPTIRVFEALACGIPLVTAPWEDAEGLFRPGRDYLLAADGTEMTRRLREVLGDEELRGSLRESGLETISSRHTCAHRVDQLLEIAAELGLRSRAGATA
jgi:spore maturation protein CgeB